MRSKLDNAIAMVYVFIALVFVLIAVKIYVGVRNDRDCEALGGKMVVVRYDEGWTKGGWIEIPVYQCQKVGV